MFAKLLIKAWYNISCL